jgi:MarR family 2-MHQ and catechol resistance regulon transcriptional repressor
VLQHALGFGYAGRVGAALERRLKMRPLDDPVVEGMLNLLVTAAAIKEVAEAEFGRFGLTSSAYNALRILRGSPDGLPRGEIAARLVHPSPDVTRLIDRLARRGLVCRLRARTDRRLSITRITEEGVALVARAEAANRAQRTALASRLSEREWRTLSALCERIYGDDV